MNSPTNSSATTDLGSDSRAHEADMRTDVEDTLGAELVSATLQLNRSFKARSGYSKICQY
jgi:hypothetical protein